MKYYCNPLCISYRYQFNRDPADSSRLQINREAADPSMILFRGRYYIFASMTLGVWHSDDLVTWQYTRLPDELPLYGYAPDARVVGDYVYLSASSRDDACAFYRTRDILNGPYEKIGGGFPFWDPNLFADDDGRVYFYWGCSNITPIYGVELDPETMKSVGKTAELILGNPAVNGFERRGEDHCEPEASPELVEEWYKDYLKTQNIAEEALNEAEKEQLRTRLATMPYIEGAWVSKHEGRYYLQYACPGTEYNIYADGCYVSKSPLGPYSPAANNPYSSKPGGFMPGAGHGSTMEDKAGNVWHISTMRISVNHYFERRIGLWPAGFDRDGELFCNQRYGDWPAAVSSGRADPWAEPDWMLLSCGKRAGASSFCEGHEPEKAAEEDARTWWRAATPDRSEWLMLDLGSCFDVHAVQVNFADDHMDIPCPGTLSCGEPPRYIETAKLVTQWKLEGSADGRNWEVLEDKSKAQTDLSHDLVVMEKGMRLRYLRLSDIAVPYAQSPCVSGLRVFGLGSGEKPGVPDFTALRTGGLDMEVTIREQADALGYNILFGHAPDKLYHSYMVFSGGTQSIGDLVKGQPCFVRVDAFNENGITHGVCSGMI